MEHGELLKETLGIGATAMTASVPVRSVYARECPCNEGTVVHVQAIFGKELAALAKECETVARNFVVNWLSQKP